MVRQRVLLARFGAAVAWFCRSRCRQFRRPPPSFPLPAAAAMLLLRRGAHPCIVDHGGHLPHHYLASGHVSCFEQFAAGEDAQAAATTFGAALLDLSRGQSVVSAPAPHAADATSGGDHETADADAFGAAVTAAIRRPWLAYHSVPLVRSANTADLLSLRAGDDRTPVKMLLQVAADGLCSTVQLDAAGNARRLFSALLTCCPLARRLALERVQVPLAGRPRSRRAAKVPSSPFRTTPRSLPPEFRLW